MARPQRPATLQYGRCINENYKEGQKCPKCASKEIIALKLTDDFKCPECGGPLSKCPPPKPDKGPNWLLIICGAVAVALITLFAIYAKSCNETPEQQTELEATETVNKPTKEPADDTLQLKTPETQKVEEPKAEESKAEESKAEEPKVEKPKEKTENSTRSVLGGAATYNPSTATITFNRAYTLDLQTRDDETIRLASGDKIRSAKVSGGYLLQGTVVSGSDERFVSGLRLKL